MAKCLKTVKSTKLRFFFFLFPSLERLNSFEEPAACKIHVKIAGSNYVKYSGN